MLHLGKINKKVARFLSLFHLRNAIRWYKNEYRIQLKSLLYNNFYLDLSELIIFGSIHEIINKIKYKTVSFSVCYKYITKTGLPAFIGNFNSENNYEILKDMSNYLQNLNNIDSKILGILPSELESL